MRQKRTMAGEAEVFRHQGFCEICEHAVVFTARNPWFRDHLRCSGCRSIPRERALMRVVKQHFPELAEICVHESSPVDRGVSARLRRERANYSFSHYFADTPHGERHPGTGIRCENLECLTFADESFDLFVTQDVMEHVFDPKAAFCSIARTLKPGGMHLFTAPLVNKFRPSERRASKLPSGEIVHHFEPIYHGNPVESECGSLMTMNWGYDIAHSIAEWTGMPNIIMHIDDIDAGIRAELIEVIVSRKP